MHENSSHMQRIKMDQPVSFLPSFLQKSLALPSKKKSTEFRNQTPLSRPNSFLAKRGNIMFAALRMALSMVCFCCLLVSGTWGVAQEFILQVPGDVATRSVAVVGRREIVVTDAAGQRFVY